MTDYAHVGSEGLKECEAICTGDAQCSCFVHTDRPDPPDYSACKTVNHSVVALLPTARGYSAYVKAK